jgi:DNA-binding NtrC family response regulator
MSAFERHRGPERRRQPRGGRRVDDKRGRAPLVLVADEDAHSREMCEAILAKLNFAVAPVDSIEKAASVLDTLHPDVIVAHGHDVSALQRAAWPSGVAFVTVTDEMRDPEALVEAVRRAIRSATTLRRA